MPKGFREVREKTGFFGTVFRMLFWSWQILMVIWLVNSMGNNPKLHAAVANPHGAYAAGTILGAGVALGAIFFFWLAGSVILGLFVILTRGPRTLISIDDEDAEL